MRACLKIAYGGGWFPGLFTKKGGSKSLPRVQTKFLHQNRTKPGAMRGIKKTCGFVHLATRFWPRGADRAALTGKEPEAVRVRIRIRITRAHTDCDANEDVHSRAVMEWWDEIVLPMIRRVWINVATRLGFQQTTGLRKLRKEVRTCEYEDVHEGGFRYPTCRKKNPNSTAYKEGQRRRLEHSSISLRVDQARSLSA
ncbi:hypothetical protein ACMD2_05573 [Ananas comosus]|uniref:Uncharacterized protein n=1 Tax=Ananas comosus TaxID=4615 RepID=A0A199VWS6_ANACO|nr:hypothetical protein ACMD2_05573 [Ananas comosus]